MGSIYTKTDLVITPKNENSVPLKIPNLHQIIMCTIAAIFTDITFVVITLRSISPKKIIVLPGILSRDFIFLLKAKLFY